MKSWVLVHMRPCVRPPRVESLFPPVLWISCTHSLLAFNTKWFGGSSFWCQTPWQGSLSWDSELTLLWENFYGIIILQFVGLPWGRGGGMEFDYISSALLYGEGNGNPLQYSCLKNPVDGGAWYATVHGVSKSWTRLSDWTELMMDNVEHLFVYL